MLLVTRVTYVTGVTYLLSFFLRLAKNRNAAAIMIAQPPMVKIVVPMPPVEGRAESLVSVSVSLTDTFCNLPLSVAVGSVIVTCFLLH